MRTRAVLGSIFGSIAVLVVGWQAGAAAAAHTVQAASTNSGSGTSTPTSTASSTPSATPTTGATASPTPTTTPSARSSSASGSFTGSSVGTPFGNVQVRIVVQSGKITDVVAVQLTNEGGRSVQISNYAAPILRKEVLSAQSANVNSVGGATYTSDGYVQSVQSALDKAGIKS